MGRRWRDLPTLEGSVGQRFNSSAKQWGFTDDELLAIQFEASHADTNNEPDQERQTIASGVLLFLGDVRFPTGEDGPLNLVKIPGGGWCFYDAAARKLGVEDWGYATLDCIALPALSIQKVDFAAYAVEDGDEAAQRATVARNPH